MYLDVLHNSNPSLIVLNTITAAVNSYPNDSLYIIEKDAKSIAEKVFPIPFNR